MANTVIRWPGGEHAFRLGIAELEVIQQATDCGPEFLLHKINAGQWAASELIEVIRNALIGGGMGDEDAKNLVHRVASQQPLILLKVPAQSALSLCLFGPPDDAVGEDLPAGDPTPNPGPGEDGSSAATTDWVRSSVSRPGK
ncbi:gene transfer agent family protein [Paracoccus laeviglucosivorans]|uniref:Phage tail tube protein, GTA-gp10 n=1 Tax=Paracoccus laeviglucosivorans TaxID=1197861 RepID=A0A521E485_9RHOB|nr:gene transfer agent family protein [Paracoccus laeviglucosivorans]SMO78737.1 Phage tail tube protein, GTA-gp10 [Paracoccus laeviglucosivorans]